MMSEAASPAAARARRCAGDVASEEEGAPSTSSATPAPAALAFPSGAALGATARCDCADFDAPGSEGLEQWLEARVRMSARLRQESPEMIRGGVRDFVFFPFEKI